MPVKNEPQSLLGREIRIVPAWAWLLGLIAFLTAQWYFNLAIARHPHPPSVWLRPLFGLLAGIGGGAFVLFIGYVGRDAKRRAMSPVLWSLVALLIPNAMGILLYFVLRQPLRRTCPQCGTAVAGDFNFCPRCSYKLGTSCPQCQRLVASEDIYCPYCGTSLPRQASTIFESRAKPPIP
jgi:RNA polymerase subunit RPABC4/transcription elongation factor Spt4